MPRQDERISCASLLKAFRIIELAPDVQKYIQNCKVICLKGFSLMVKSHDDNVYVL